MVNKNDQRERRLHIKPSKKEGETNHICTDSAKCMHL